MSRPGWSPGNSLSFEIYGSGRRAAESQDGESANAPTLNFEYTRYIPTSVEMGQQSALQQQSPITAIALFLMLATIFYLALQVVYKPKD